MIRLAALFCGLICGIGLVIADMTDPARLTGFLSVGDAWDPTFGIGLASAVAVAFIGFRWADGRKAPVLSGTIPLQPARPALWTLAAASLLFGIGMGLSGFTPGTALVAGGLFVPKAAVFVACVLGGMILHDVFSRTDGKSLRETFRSRG
jgi:uncharacterized membrane protein YedE/YeeE